jgi:hypothetical protein
VGLHEDAGGAMKYFLRGLLLGLLMAFLVWLAERTTGRIAWGLIIGFPICWGIAGYLFWRWDIGGYRKEQG